MPNMSFKSYSKDGAAEAEAAQVEQEPAPKQGCVLLPEPAPWLRCRHPLLIVSPQTGDAALVFSSFYECNQHAAWTMHKACDSTSISALHTGGYRL